MKRQVLIAIVTALVLALIILIFPGHFKTPDAVMRPPTQGKENAAILKAFRKAIGKNTQYQLQYPASGSYRSAFIRHDLDGDKEDEVIVFYTRELAESTVRFNILDNQDGEWLSVLDEEGYGNGIDSVHFTDLQGNGSPELIFSWDSFAQTDDKRLTAHAIRVGEDQVLTIQTLLDQPYSTMGLADMDGDSIDELFVVWTDRSERSPKTYATLFKMDNTNRIKTCGQSAILDSGVSGYPLLQFQQNGKQNIAFLDAYKGTDSRITEVVYWDDSRQALVSPFTDPQSLSNTRTIRPKEIATTDIDGDHNLEIPIRVDRESAQTTPGTEQLPMLCWNEFSLDGTMASLTPKTYSLYDPAEEYSLSVDPDLADSLTGFRATDTGVVTVYGRNGDPYFSIVRKNRSSLSEKDTFTFRKFKGSSAVYGTLTSAGKDAGFTDALIEQSLLIF